MSSVAIIHSLRHDSRSTTVQNVLSFSRYLPADSIHNVNAFGLIPEKTQFDAVILTYDFLWLRTWPIWSTLTNRIADIIHAASVRVAMPQDDYVCCDILDQFLCDYSITHVYTPILHDLGVLYPKATAKGVHFETALTGYVDEHTFARVQSFSRAFPDRAWDLGQRVRLLEPHLGSEATAKGQIALNFVREANAAGFKCNVSTKPEDVLLGDDWYRFLGDSRFTVGALGGASLADPKGRLTDHVRRMRVRHPEISNDEISQKLNLSSGRKGNFTAVSPRLFESAAMGVCQILQPGQYLDGFEPWVHYVPLDKFMTGSKRVFEVMRDHGHAQQIVDASRSFLIDSEKFTYRYFLLRLAKEIGLRRSKTETLVSDSSVMLDPAAAPNGQNLKSLQKTLRSYALKGKLRRLERDLSSERAVHVSNACTKDHFPNSLALLPWIREFRNGRLLVESLSVPWRSASSYLTET